MFSALEILSTLLILVSICALFFAIKWQMTHAQLAEMQHQQNLNAQRVVQPKQAFDPKLQDLYAAKHESDLKVGFADEDDLAILFVDICQFSRNSQPTTNTQFFEFVFFKDERADPR